MFFDAIVGRCFAHEERLDVGAARDARLPGDGDTRLVGRRGAEIEGG